jgi:hypothetical protein
VFSVAASAVQHTLYLQELERNVQGQISSSHGLDLQQPVVLQKFEHTELGLVNRLTDKACKLEMTVQNRRERKT